MLKLQRTNAQMLYTAIQSLFWLTYGLMFAFAATYLQGRSFSNSGIGIVLGCSYGLSTILQPVIAALFTRKNIQAEQGLCGIYVVVIVLSILLLVVPLSKAGIALAVVFIFSLVSALQPSVDTLAKRWSSMGCPVNYGASRGLGSLFYAGMTAGMGLLLQKISPRLIPFFYLGTMVASVLILKIIHIPRIATYTEEDVLPSSRKTSCENPRFKLFLIGVSCISLGHVLVDNFMLQIMQNIGGNSGNMGIAISIASLVEFPAMMMYSRLGKRFGAAKLLIFSAWACFIKNLIILFAVSPVMVYAAEILQFASYGIYIPASIDYIAQIFPAKENLKGQSFAGSAYTVGSVIATLIGGILLDVAGIGNTLRIMVGITFVGALLFAISIRKAEMSD